MSKEEKTRHRLKPTVVLVHGAFEDASAWNDVIRRLHASGYPVVAPAVPLRGVASDIEYLDAVLKAIPGPITLVGHSYGGVLVSGLAAQNPAVEALVYVAAFIPEAGDTVSDLNSQFPGSILGPDTSFTIEGDLYVKQESYRQLYAADRLPSDALVAATTQRPLAVSALTETITATAPVDVPKFALIAENDRAVPAAAERWQAERAGARVYSVSSAHDMAVSHPATVAAVIEAASR